MNTHDYALTAIDILTGLNAPPRSMAQARYMLGHSGYREVQNFPWPIELDEEVTEEVAKIMKGKRW